MANIADLHANGVQKYSSAALENGHQISTTQSILFGFDGRNTDTVATIYVMVFDSATAATGASIPVIVIEVPPNTGGGSGNFSYQSPVNGIQFTNGIYIAASSSDAITFTAIATNKTFFHVQYAHEDGSGTP